MKKLLPIIRTTALVGAALMIVVAIAFSWFTFDTNTEMDKIEGSVVDVMTNDALIFGENNGVIDWHEQIRTDDVTFVPLVGNGLKFFEQKDAAGGDRNEYAPYTGVGYLDMNFKLKGKNRSELVLGATSYVRPASLQDDGTISDKKDLAAGALRVSVAKKGADGEYTTLLIWIPNVKYFVKAPENVGESFDTSVNGAMESSYSFQNSIDLSDATRIFPTTDGAEGDIIENGMYRDTQTNILYVWGEPSKIKGLIGEPLCVCEADTVDEFKLTIWLDGNDRECRDIIIGGRVNALISFDTIVVEQSE